MQFPVLLHQFFPQFLSNFGYFNEKYTVPWLNSVFKNRKPWKGNQNSFIWSKSVPEFAIGIIVQLAHIEILGAATLIVSHGTNFFSQFSPHIIKIKCYFMPFVDSFGKKCPKIKSNGHLKQSIFYFIGYSRYQFAQAGI